MRVHLFFGVAFFFEALTCLGQAPVSSFTLDPNACRQQQLKLTNTSTGATAYEWDFCANDTETLSINGDLATIPGLSGGYGYKIVNDGNLCFGFAVSQSSHSIYRLDFGSSPLNIPTVTNLGSFGGLILFPTGIEIYHHAGNWYGFIGLYDPNAGIVRLDFGTSLTNIPTAQNLGMFGQSGRFWNMRVVEQSGNLILVITNRNASSIVRVNYRNSFNNVIDNATHVFSDVIAGANLTPGFDITKVGNDWIALVASDLNSTIIQIKFTNDILTSPTVEGSYSTNITRPMQVKLLQEGNHYVATVASEFVNLKMIDYKDLNPVNVPVEISHPTLPLLFAVDAVRHKGKSVIQGVGSNNKLRNLVFQSACGVSSDYSESFEPAGIMYSSAGSKNIELRSLNADGSSSFSQPLTVSANQAPDIDFTTNGNVCAGHAVGFGSSNASGNITDYLWSFDDTNTSTSPNPNHQYSLSGNYDVNLLVTSNTGCQNYVEKTVFMYNEPIPDFILPANNPLCTNQSYVFDNTSNTDPGFPVTWQWQIDGTGNFSQEDLIYTFNSTALQNVKLMASIPGCQNEVTKPVSTLVDGPNVNFTVAGNCEDVATAFTNTTTGSVTSYLWDFDNGQSSTNADPLYAYPNIGTYDVELTAFSANGCNNTLVKSVAIYSTPQVNFAASLPPFSCNGSPTQFNDLTNNPTDSNITGWQWDFDDGGNASSLKNPQYTYALAGTYDVSLTVTTNYACSATLQLPVLISQSPVPDFTHAPLCEDLPVNFSGTSSGTIQSWNWMIGGTSYSVQNPTHTFLNPVNTNATLTVTDVNNCIGTITKPISVKAKQMPDFSFTKNCTEQQTQFTDMSPPTSDPIALRSWDFDGLGTATGSPATFSFFDARNYNVKMTVTTNAGCVYPVTKTVNVVTSPVPNFITTPQSNAPLTVHYTNTSANATSYLWKFHDANNTTSTQVSPSFTYPSFGAYQTELTASNALGCFNTVIKQVDVVVPVYDLALNGLSIEESQPGIFHPGITIYNKSNVAVNSIDLLIDANGERSHEMLDQLILPNSSYRYIMSYQITTESNEGHLCVEAEIDDVAPLDNRVCLLQVPSFEIYPPYPNPAKGVMTLDIILYEDGIVNLTMINSMGQEVRNVKVNCGEGLNPLQIETQNLAAGPYILKVNYTHTVTFYKISIAE